MLLIMREVGAARWTTHIEWWEDLTSGIDLLVVVELGDGSVQYWCHGLVSRKQSFIITGADVSFRYSWRNFDFFARNFETERQIPEAKSGCSKVKITSRKEPWRVVLIYRLWLMNIVMQQEWLFGPTYIPTPVKFSISCYIKQSFYRFIESCR